MGGLQVTDIECLGFSLTEVQGSAQLAPSVQVQRGAGHSMFFLDAVLVAPNRTRPPQRVNNTLFEHPHNVSLVRVGALWTSECRSTSQRCTANVAALLDTHPTRSLLGWPAS